MRFAFIFVALALIGCGSDDGGSPSKNGTDSGTGGSGGSGGSGGVAQCVSQATSACEKCLCTDCFSQLGQCIADFGCPVILQCAANTGCTGASCYQPGTCKGVIDSFGGPFGQSTQMALSLVSCSSSQGCPCGLGN